MSSICPSASVSRLVIAATMVLGACAGGATVAVPVTQPVRIAAPDSAPLAMASALPPAFIEQFAAADARARAISFWMQCTPSVARLRAEGAFGPASRAPRVILCQRTTDGVPVGGVYDVDSTFSTIRRLQLVRLDGARPRFTEPVDTAHIALTARLARDVTASVTAEWKRRGRPFSVVPITRPDGQPEAWVVPRATKARSYVSGGDAGYAAGANRAPVLIADRTSTWTQLNLAPTGALRIYSSVREVAAVSDLATARYHAELGRAVTVSTPMVESTIVPGLDPETGARLVWKHTLLRP